MIAKTTGLVPQVEGNPYRLVMGDAKYTPPLLVYDDVDRPIAVYPHLEAGRKAEVLEYLADPFRGRECPLSQ